MKFGFVFSGQGAQRTGMGKDLYESSAAARSVFERADTVLGRSVSKLCFEGPDEVLTGSANCQPAIYTMSSACLAAFQERFPGVKPAAAAGLSLGEYAALACAGAFAFEDGLRLVARRGELMDAACQAAQGGMASIIACDPAVISEVCAKHDIDVANYNCPGQIVISGPTDCVELACAELKERGAKRAIILKVAGAFHSRMMKSAGEGLAEVLKTVAISAPAIPVAQNFIGDLIEDDSRIKANLIAQVDGSVRWDSCVKKMMERCGADAFIEFGPGSVLTGLIRKIAPGIPLFNVSCAEDLDKISI